MSPEQLESGVRTVTHLAKYFDELRAATDALAATPFASERGYFKPSEDEQLRALLVSYWHSRAALLEMIAGYRLEVSLNEDARPKAFIVAMTGALLLIDAARYLRDKFHHRPVVRRKLNEPAPHFGIPANSYDQVQRSLLSARHVWHLYHATRYLEENEAELRQLAAGTNLEPVMEILDRLRYRLNVRASSYAEARLRMRGRQAWQGLSGVLVGRALYGLQKVSMSMMAYVSVRPGHRPTLPEMVRQELTSVLLPGDVLIVRKEYAITNYFLPGYWPHAALYLGGCADLERLGIANHASVKSRWAKLCSTTADGQPCVLESMRDGVLVRSVNSPYSSDSIVVLRPEIRPEYIAQALTRALSHEGKAYDFDFDFSRDDRLVCTEVVYRGYDGTGGAAFELQRRAGRVTLSAGDLLDMSLSRNVFRPVAIYAKSYGPKLLVNQFAEPAIRALHGRCASE